ncbi:hypothetical protein [Leptolyngbya sp. 7M]|uniref:hypothetical protein n=1 Tax=Leptolyngbya sp. 7M TaxID=2812896 RepID=UPI001B8D637C|nr:hypothetical protein [Leptolyngbya sp. 7M]QYO67268.1 hypothetical protein JVX88_10940 [Leptolyngbya sp. 7M]
MNETQRLANGIAKLLENEQRSNDVAALFASLEKLNHRIDKIEARLEGQERSIEARIAHPSLDKLSIAEAIADRVFGTDKDERACAFEPNGKPCDHCSMCNTRGF